MEQKVREEDHLIRRRVLLMERVEAVLLQAALIALEAVGGTVVVVAAAVIAITLAVAVVGVE